MIYRPVAPLLGAVVLATCVSAFGRTPNVLAATAPAPGKLLFSAKFSAQYANSIPGFKASKGVLSYDGSGDTSLIVPYSTKHHASFAVQATMRQRGTTQPDNPLVGYGITVRQSSSNSDAGIYAGSYFSPSSIFNNPLIMWAGDSVGGAQFTPDTSWHIYRLEVRGTQYRLLIDKIPVVSFTISDFRNDNQIGIFSAHITLQVKNFKVYSLSSAPAPAALPPVKNLGLKQTDVPAGLMGTIGHYFTNQEVARDAKTTEAALQAAGQLITYQTSFENVAATAGLFYVVNVITAFSRAAGAQTDYQASLAGERGLQASSSGVTSEKEQTVTSVGDSATLFILEYSSQGQAYRECLIELVRGSYHAAVSTTFLAGDDPNADAAQAINLAKIVDTRIQSSG